MSNLLSDTDYPPFSGATGKKDMLVQLWANKDSPGALIGVIARISHSDLNGFTDKNTDYDPDGIFAAS